MLGKNCQTACWCCDAGPMGQLVAFITMRQEAKPTSCHRPRRQALASHCSRERLPEFTETFFLNCLMLGTYNLMLPIAIGFHSYDVNGVPLTNMERLF